MTMHSLGVLAHSPLVAFVTFTWRHSPEALNTPEWTTLSKKWRNHCINHLDIQAWQLLNTLKFYSKLMCRKVEVQKLSIIITWLGQPSTIVWRCTTVAAIKGIYICTDDTNSCRQAIPSWINICPPKCVMVSTAGWRFLRFLYTRWNNPSDP
jgi:hypothetical protein